MSISLYLYISISLSRSDLSWSVLGGVGKPTPISFPIAISPSLYAISLILTIILTITITITITITTTGDASPDLRALRTADILVVTPEKWDSVSRGWQNRDYVRAVGLVILDEVHLLGVDRGPVRYARYVT